MVSKEGDLRANHWRSPPREFKSLPRRHTSLFAQGCRPISVGPPGYYPLPLYSITKVMTICRYNAIRYLTAGLPRSNVEEQAEIGLGTETGMKVFNRFVDIYRIVFDVNRELLVTGYYRREDIYDRHLSGRLNLDVWSFRMVEAALAAFQAVRGDDHRFPRKVNVVNGIGAGSTAAQNSFWCWR